MQEQLFQMKKEQASRLEAQQRRNVVQDETLAALCRGQNMLLEQM